jgi:adenylate cyclase
VGLEGEAEDLKVRIGIHLGDVVDKGGDLFGTAVNVSARLEAIAQPGGIVVSAAVRDAIAGKLGASFADLGQQALKTSTSRFEHTRSHRRLAPSRRVCPRMAQALPLPAKPPIAVLPFENLSGDHDQEYFAAPGVSGASETAPRSKAR